MRVMFAALVALATPAFAQAPGPQPIAAPADAPFAHGASGITLPVTLAGFARTKLVENEAPQLDIAAEYARGTDEVVTVFIYRTTSGSVPVWFDRATWAIENRGVFGTPVRADRPLTFTPPGQARESAMRAAWALSGSRLRSTALAIVPVGEWLVKLRLSSVSLDTAAIDARMNAAMAGLGWPAAIAPAPVAAPVAPCTTSLKLHGKAKPAKQESAASLLGALMAGITPTPAPDASPVVWCRDSTTLPMGGVYRPGGAQDAYLIALSDAGRGVSVGPSVAPQVFGTGKASWSVDLALPGQTLSYAAQDRLPPPDQVMKMLSGRMASRTTTWGTKRSITLPASSLR